MKADFEKGTKVCGKCKQELPLLYFAKDRSSKDGMYSRCKPCHTGKPLRTKIETKLGFKHCSSCREEKPKQDFYLSRIRKDGLDYHCKTCRLQINQTYVDTHPDRVKKQHALYYANNQEAILSKCSQQYEENRDAILSAGRVRYQNNKELVLMQHKAWRHLNPLYMKEYRKVNRDSLNAKVKDRFKRDPIWKMSCLLRVRLCHVLKQKAFRRTTKFSQYIGCTPEELRAHIEKQFQAGMTWGNHTLRGWHVDHIIPLDSASSIEELYERCHYTNLQPLWAMDNIRKGNKLP